MIDARLRRWLEGPLDRAAQRIDVEWLSPDRLTAAGLVLGLGSAAAAAAAWWLPALALWLLSRACDGLDGPLARRRERAAASRGEAISLAGGFFDITADFVVYGATVVGVAIGATGAEGASWWPFLLVLFAYYVNGAALLAFSSLAERTGRQIDDDRSLSFLGGLAEGTETIVVHSLWLVWPGSAGAIATVWAAVVGVSAAHRIVMGR
ncbi:MAG: CDP-alcohol phosphatidyltransferase family protein, partial [Terracoccus sp.]